MEQSLQISSGRQLLTHSGNQFRWQSFPRFSLCPLVTLLPFAVLVAFAVLAFAVLVHILVKSYLQRVMRSESRCQIQNVYLHRNKHLKHELSDISVTTLGTWQATTSSGICSHLYHPPNITTGACFHKASHLWTLTLTACHLFADIFSAPVTAAPDDLGLDKRGLFALMQEI